MVERQYLSNHIAISLLLTAPPSSLGLFLGVYAVYEFLFVWLEASQPNPEWGNDLNKQVRWIGESKPEWGHNLNKQVRWIDEW